MKSGDALYVGLDVGGTSMKAGVVNDDGKPLSDVSLPTEPEKGQEFGLARMAEAIEKAVQGAGLTLTDIAAMGVATPGTMDIPAGIILDPPNMKPWRNVPVRKYIEDRFGLPTAFQNDANAAAYGEFWAGAGRDVHSMALFTLGTGVGGGIIIGDLVVEGEHSHGAELGHMKIEMTNPRLCGCGKWGCLEAYASATAVVKRTQELLDKPGTSSMLAQIAASGRELTARDVFDAALAGDPVGEKIVDQTAFYLALGASNVMHCIDPNMVVFGGGMIATGEWFLERIRKYVHKVAFPVPARETVLCYAHLGPDAGFIGAAACARLLRKRSRLT